MRALTVSRFEPSPDAYEALAALWTALEPEWPRIGRIWAHIDEAEHGAGPVLRFVAHRDGELVAAGDVGTPTYGGPGTFELSLFARPEPEGPEALGRIHDALMEELEPRGPRTLIAFVRDTRPWAVRFFEQRGYAVAQETAFSRLDVAAFDAAPFVDRTVAVAREGYRIVSASRLAAEGVAWERDYWRLDETLLRDVPMLGGFRPRAFEDFARDLRNPDRFCLEATYIAFDPEGEQVGTSRLCAIAEVQESIFAGLTGVRRSHRRRGLAVALKLATAGYAREQGYRWIHALNEVDNPMRRLNEALGFERRYTQLTMRKEMG